MSTHRPARDVRSSSLGGAHARKPRDALRQVDKRSVLVQTAGRCPALRRKELSRHEETRRDRKRVPLGEKPI